MTFLIELPHGACKLSFEGLAKTFDVPKSTKSVVLDLAR